MELLTRLREMGCDREPFTDAHTDCICRLTNAAANQIERLRERKAMTMTQDEFKRMSESVTIRPATAVEEAMLARIDGLALAMTGVTPAGLRNLADAWNNIDKDQLIEAGVITAWGGGSDWSRFNDDPMIFIIKLPQDRLAALCALLNARTPK